MIGDFVYAPPTDPYVEVIHQDQDILVLNKPSGLLSVPGKAAEHADCLETRAQQQFPTSRTVHRLDMDTSGVVIMAMNAQAHRHLGLQFERRHTAKTYIADVFGNIENSEGTIDLPLRCDWPNRPKQMVDHDQGRSAQTNWLVLERHTTWTRVELKPITGRSHQLRVHMLELGHPILGDRFYATGKALVAADRLRLHAQSLTVHHPDGGARLTFEAELPF
ncbi:pseudouridine synthase [Maritalea sp.]|jgi:tRNA pseudouridine32 synthase/23S rRNA pseudouridine746 synthase|uniref:pseudouridine synthase n=1 Tax=Maritalea sp. TaxID=2003361 RepID=UPI0039E6402D